MNFRQIIGQKTVTETLDDHIRQARVGHAYLFYGAEGIGKFTAARAFAAAIMCTDPQDGQRCGRCESCTLSDRDTNPDLKVIEPTERKTSIGVDPIRFISADMITNPLYSARKVYIIRRGEGMTPAAQNALLKTLEEPPLYVTILILCANISLMLDTVKSRVTRIDFARLTTEELRTVLANHMIDPAEDEGVFAYADGLPGRAISYFEDEEIGRIRGALMEAVESLSTGSAAARVRSTKLFSDLKDKKDFVFFTLLSFYRDMALLARYGQRAVLQNRQQTEALTALAERVGFYKAEACLELIDKTWKRLRQNVNYDLAVSCMLMKIQEVLYD